jgi:hypothetical protein
MQQIPVCLLTDMCLLVHSIHIIYIYIIEIQFLYLSNFCSLIPSSSSIIMSSSYPIPDSTIRAQHPVVQATIREIQDAIGSGYIFVPDNSSSSTMDETSFNFEYEYLNTPYLQFKDFDTSTDTSGADASVCVFDVQDWFNLCKKNTKGASVTYWQRIENDEIKTIIQSVVDASYPNTVKGAIESLETLKQTQHLPYTKLMDYLYRLLKTRKEEELLPLYIRVLLNPVVSPPGANKYIKHTRSVLSNHVDVFGELLTETAFDGVDSEMYQLNKDVIQVLLQFMLSNVCNLGNRLSVLAFNNLIGTGTSTLHDSSSLSDRKVRLNLCFLMFCAYRHLILKSCGSDSLVMPLVPLTDEQQNVIKMANSNNESALEQLITSPDTSGSSSSSNEPVNELKFDKGTDGEYIASCFKDTLKSSYKEAAGFKWDNGSEERLKKILDFGLSEFKKDTGLILKGDENKQKVVEALNANVTAVHTFFEDRLKSDIAMKKAAVPKTNTSQGKTPQIPKKK